MDFEPVTLSGAGFARWLATTVKLARTEIGWSQAELASRARTSQATVWRIESNTAKGIDLITVERILTQLTLQITVSAGSLALDDRRRQNDGLHAIVNGHVARHVGRLMGEVRTEQEILGDGAHGWIDCLGYRAADRALLMDETKTVLPDMGELQRQVAFYERRALGVARRLGWRPTTVVVAVIMLDTDANAARIANNRTLVEQAFPGSVATLNEWLRTPGAPPPTGWTLAMTNPLTRSADWLVPPILGKVRRIAAFKDLADARSRLIRP